MAIQFARCEYVSRSSGANACRKASYNQRESIHCERTGELFSFKERAGNAHHEILLPIGVDETFKKSSVLWNEVEMCERRINSQLAKEFVIALPDDREVTLEDRVELTRRFSQIFVEKGVAAQLDVHSPHEGEKNWHAHLLVTTRRFSEDGLTFAQTKARDLDPVIRRKTVVEADLWGEVWRDIQNTYFEEKGYDIKVDPIGLVSQEHLGPVRMRHHLNEAILRSQMLQKTNEALSQDPKNVLEEITRTKSFFSSRDVELFLQKYVPFTERKDLLGKVLENPQLISLYDKETKEKTAYFTTKKVRVEEEKLIRFADIIANKSTFRLSSIHIEKGLEGKSLSAEQKMAYNLCVNSRQNLCLIQGRAGVGKSYVLNSIRKAHEASRFRVLGLALTHKVAMDLKKDGFEAKTCHSFLFAFKNGREKLDSSTLVIVDEAGMLGTELMVELFNVIKNKGAKLVLVGDDRQLGSVERGGAFHFLAERYGAIELKDVRRQSIPWQKQISEELSHGNIKDAVYILQENKAISWKETKEEALADLLKDWAKDSFLNPRETRQIITQKNVDVDALNQGARDVLRQQGKLGDIEIICSTLRGRLAFAEGDRIQFTKTDKEQNLHNGSFGVVEEIDSKARNIKIKLDNGEIKDVNPNVYDGLQHGYAATVYKSQGSTLPHVYVLHSKIATQPTNYVALTRQTKSLSLYVSKKETLSEAHLIHQMSRQDRKGTSLEFDTRKNIEKRQSQKSLSTSFKHKAKDFFTTIKDFFHKNERFYKIEKPKATFPEKPLISVVESDSNKIALNNLISMPLQLKDKQNSVSFSQNTLEKPSQKLSSYKVTKVIEDPPLSSPHSHLKEVQKSKIKKLETKTTNKTFQEIEKQCTQYLYNYLEKEKRFLTSELTERISLQAERAANFIYHAHTVKGTNPTVEQTKLFLLRAKYELDRIPEIQRDIIKGWQRENRYNEKKDPLIAHMIAERQASIEGRLYFEVKKKGQAPAFNIADLAEKELEKHRAQTKELAKKISDKYSLSESAATFCAKNVLRYKETHGEKPSADQVSNMVKIARELEKREYGDSTKRYESHEVEYLRRKEGDTLFRGESFKEKLSQIHEFQHIQSKTSLETPTLKITQEPETCRQIDLSL